MGEITLEGQFSPTSPRMWATKHVTDVQPRPTPMWPTGTTVTEPTVDPSRVSESCLFKPVLSAVMGAPASRRSGREPRLAAC